MASTSQHNWNGSQMGGTEATQSFGNNAPLSENSEKRARKLREWYRIGQAYFRGFFNHDMHVVQLNDALQHLSNRSDAEKDGFLMGWQSDVYAYENGLEFSEEGSDNYIDEDQDYGYIVEDEGRDVLVESGFRGSNA